MRQSFHIATLMVAAAFALEANAAPPFYTRCLERLSCALKLNLPDSLGENVDNDSTWQFRGKALRIRTNVYGDVSHIGYKLFDTQWAADYTARPLLDFLERYALEQDVPRKDVDKEEEAVRKRLTFIEGDASMIAQRTPEMGCVIDEVERRRYTVSWEKGNQKICMVIPADYQLFLGANAVELEHIFERDVKRMSSEAVEDKWREMWKNGTRSRADSVWIISNGCYLSDQIRSDLYLQGSGADMKLLLDSSKPLRSVSNVLLTGCFHKSIPMQLTIDKYGYLKSDIEVTLQQLLAYFHSENCMLYLGVKSRTKESASLTLFAVNFKMAYNHTISVEFPFNILEGGEDKVKGRIYVYTPLQNITEKFFIDNLKQNEP